MNQKLIILGVLALFLVNCENKNKTPSQDFKRVKYTVVERDGGIKKRSYSGITQSSSITNLSFRSGGLIVELNAKVGQRVNKGDLLARLDQKDAQLAYDQALVDVQNSKAQFDAAASGFDRVKKLYETNNASLSDYEAAKSTYSSAQSAYQISLKRLDLQGSKLNYTLIKAPMKGVISGINSEINEVVQAGRTIIVISKEGEKDMEVLVGVPEKYINEVKNGDLVDVEVGSINANFSGVVTEVAYASLNTGVTYPVTISVDSKGNDAMRPDMPVNVTFDFGISNKQSVLVAPLKAVASDTDGNYVFRLQLEGEDLYRVEKVTVELGAITKNGYIVKTGVSEGDLLVVAGLRSLYDGLQVKLLNNN